MATPCSPNMAVKSNTVGGIKETKNRKAQSQMNDIIGCKKKQSCEIKESEPEKRNNTAKSSHYTGEDKSEACSKM